MEPAATLLGILFKVQLLMNPNSPSANRKTETHAGALNWDFKRLGTALLVNTPTV